MTEEGTAGRLGCPPGAGSTEASAHCLRVPAGQRAHRSAPACSSGRALTPECLRPVGRRTATSRQERGWGVSHPSPWPSQVMGWVCGRARGRVGARAPVGEARRNAETVGKTGVFS